MTEFEKQMIDHLTDDSGNFISQRINESYLRKKGYYEYLINRFSDNTTDKIIEVLYRIKNNILVVPVCKHCGNPVSYSRNIKGYPVFCSNKCTNSDPDVLRKNAENVSASNKKAYAERKGDILAKRSKSLRELTGEDNTGSPFSCKSIREKSKKTMVERYGTETYIVNKKKQNESVDED